MTGPEEIRVVVVLSSGTAFIVAGFGFALAAIAVSILGIGK